MKEGRPSGAVTRVSVYLQYVEDVDMSVKRGVHSGTKYINNLEGNRQKIGGTIHNYFLLWEK